MSLLKTIGGVMGIPMRGLAERYLGFRASQQVRQQLGEPPLRGLTYARSKADSCILATGLMMNARWCDSMRAELEHFRDVQYEIEDARQRQCDNMEREIDKAVNLAESVGLKPLYLTDITDVGELKKALQEHGSMMMTYYQQDKPHHVHLVGINDKGRILIQDPDGQESDSRKQWVKVLRSTLPERECAPVQAHELKGFLDSGESEFDLATPGLSVKAVFAKHKRLFGRYKDRMPLLYALDGNSEYSTWHPSGGASSSRI